jgi:hypothetical protein
VRVWIEDRLLATQAASAASTAFIPPAAAVSDEPEALAVD